MKIPAPSIAPPSQVRSFGSTDPSKERDGKGPVPADSPSGPTPEERRDRNKALIFFFGAIALMIVAKLIMGLR